MVSPNSDPISAEDPTPGQKLDNLSVPRRGPLYLHQWTVRQPLGKVLMLHGKGDYGGRFAELGAKLQEIGWSCYAPDMYGFGRSPGPRCWMWSFKQILKDLECVQQRLEPQIWGGYSTGANWSIEYALAHPEQVQGLILISPALRIDHLFTPYTQALLPILNQIAPQLTVIRKYNPTRVTSVPYRQQELWHDPWIRGTTRVRFIAELVRSGRYCIDQAHRLSVPILILYSSRDRIINPVGVEEFVAALQASSAQVTLQEFPDSGHDLLHDVDDEPVQRTIQDWVQQFASIPQPSPDRISA